MERGFQRDIDKLKLSDATLVLLQVVNEVDPQTVLDCLELDGDLNLLGTMSDWAACELEGYRGKRYDIYLCKDGSILASVDNADDFKVFKNIEALQAWMRAHEPNATFGEMGEE